MLPYMECEIQDVCAEFRQERGTREHIFLDEENHFAFHRLQQRFLLCGSRKAMVSLKRNRCITTSNCLDAQPVIWTENEVVEVQVVKWAIIFKTLFLHRKIQKDLYMKQPKSNNQI